MIGDRPGASIRASGWGWRHAGRKAWAVSDLDIAIEPGERVLLLGASGSGKSTLMHALAGVLGGAEEGESRGSLLIDGDQAQSIVGRAGLVMQDPDAQVILSRIGDDVAFGCENLGVPRSEIWPRVRSALDAVGLDLPLDHSTDRLSGGQKQRLALAGALAMRPQLLLLDEPTANLDPDGVRDVRDATARVLDHTDATFIVVEHRVDVWHSVVDRVIVLGTGGGVLADGPTDEVLQRMAEPLAAAGIWVPSVPPRVPARAVVSASGSWDLRAADLTIGRAGVSVQADLDLEVPSGLSTVVVGPNGIGKTTLALTVAGLLPPLGGGVEASADLARGLNLHPIRWKSADLLTRIGTVFQEPEHQFVARTVREELAIGPRALRLPVAERHQRIDELLERLHLAALAEANPFSLSGGEKRRLSVGTVLASRPRVLVLDEPTFGQDRLTWTEMVTMLQELVADGTTLFSVTHDAAYRAALGDCVIELGPRPAVVP